MLPMVVPGKIESLFIPAVSSGLALLIQQDKEYLMLFKLLFTPQV